MALEETRTKDKRKPQLKDIAERTGLAVSTISLVLNGHRTTGHISQTTRQEVLAVAEELGYERPARTRRPRLHRVGVFSSPGSVFWGAVREVCQVLNEQDYRPVVQVGYAADTCQFARDLFERFEIDGVIFIGGFNESTDLLPAEMPSVLMGAAPPGWAVTSVDMDDHAAGRLAGQHLWGLGHRAVYLVGEDHVSRLLREQGLREFWQEQGAPESAVSTLHVPLPELGEATGGAHEAAFVDRLGEILEAPLATRASAMFCTTDAWAFRTIRALHRLGLRVPEDVSVVGVDDVAAAADYDPALTTVRQSFRDQGAGAAQLLLHILQAPTPPAPVRELHPPELILRESTGPVEMFTEG